jgi:hypothetical protein
MAECILTDTAWTENEVYEGIYEPLREAMTRLQTAEVQRQHHESHEPGYPYHGQASQIP